MTVTRPAIIRATIMITVSACCFGSLTTFTLLVTRGGISLVGAIFWRFLLGAVFLFLITGRDRAEHPVNATAWRLMAIGGIAQATISYLSFKALDYLPVGILAFLFYTYPAWVAVISAMRGKEELTKSRLIALVMAMTGIAIMVGASGANSLSSIGVALALGTAFLYALYLPMVHDVQRRLPPFLSSFYLVTGIATTFLIVNVVTGQLRIPRDPEVWGYLVVLSLVGTVLAFGTLMAGLQVLGPVRTSIISTIEPFFTAVLGALILRQALTISILTGGAMIAAAVVVVEAQRGLIF